MDQTSSDFFGGPRSRTETLGGSDSHGQFSGRDIVGLEAFDQDSDRGAVHTDAGPALLHSARTKIQIAR